MSTRSRVFTPRRFQTIALISLVFLVAIIITGAGVRLTGSGLGCTVEFVNRLISGLVAVPVLIAAVGSVVMKPRRRDLIWPAMLVVVGVGAPAILGAIVVKQHLAPPRKRMRR